MNTTLAGGVLKPMRGDGAMAAQSLFPEAEGGSIPTSPLQLTFRLIGPSAAAVAYDRWHYLKDRDFFSTFNYGAYFGQQFEGAISFGPPNAKTLQGYWSAETQKGWWEILRLAMSPNCPKNSESRFIAITTKLLRRAAFVRGMVAYADDGVGHVGTIYKAAGFSPCGLTAQKTDFYVDGKIQWRGITTDKVGEWKPRSRKWLFVKQFA